MMIPTVPLTKDLVLIGGGHTHALVLRSWAMKPLPGVRLTLIDPAPSAAYSGMLPGFVAGHYRRDDLDIDLVRLARMAGARLILGAAEGIDRAAGVVHVPGRPVIAYDACSIDIGITSAMPDLPGFAEHGVPAKPLGPFAARWAAFLASAGPTRVAVIGGGVAGAEIAMAMAYALRANGSGRAPNSVTVLDRGPVGKELGPAERRRLLAAMDGFGIERREGVTVERVEAGRIGLANGEDLPVDFVTGAAGARPYDWIAGTGLDLELGFVRVGPTLQSSDPAVFAAGDCAHLSHAPRPKAGVYAVREAPVLAHNLSAFLSGGPLRRYRPQDDYLKLISLGGKAALAQRFGAVLSGPLMWRWKDRIDRRFMDRFQKLSPMDVPRPVRAALGVTEEIGDGPPCAGCGAKAGRGTLQAVLLGPVGDDAAILKTGGARQVISTDHLKAVTEDPFRMARIAAVHALGDIWAMGADPQAALATIILPRMSAALQARTLAEIMAGARAIFGETPIVGGHTSLGTDLTIGFTVTGLCAGQPITLGGAKPGDVLILTKPIGSGTVLAGEMRGLARGEDVAATLAAMEVPQGAASAILRDAATAMTDVTGFGLAGHLMNLCEASEVAARVDAAAVPLMPGAEALALAGVRSSLFARNRADLGGISLPPLMYDPQTAGGLLAAVPAETVADLLARLTDANYPATRIGEIVDGAPYIVSA